jgi:ankyrin repeat protein
MKRILALLAAVFLGSARFVSGADGVNEALQKGLFEEEANHNLEAAIQAYQSVIKQFDDQRKFAATAIFRLGECYRKQGKTNEATAQYQRIVQEFADQPALATLSQQNLSGLGARAAIGTKPSEPIPATSAEAEEVQRIKVLIKGSPDLVNAKNQNDETPLQKAAGLGQLSVAEFLLANNADVDARGSISWTPLQKAAIYGHRAIAELLLKHGAEVNRRDWTSPLHLAAQKGYTAVAEVLLDHNADVNAKEGFSGATPLHYAAQNGHNLTVKLLMARGADLNARLSFPPNPNTIPNLSEPPRKEQSGDTPLHLASQAGHPFVVMQLVEKGAQVSAQNDVGQTPLHRAVSQQQISVAEYLVAHEADINAKPTGGAPALNVAILGGSLAIVELLLKNGADVNAQGADQKSPLHLAVDQRSAEIVRLLLGYKPELEVKDGVGFTPLQEAVLSRNTIIAEALLKAGADPNAKMNGNTPLHAAVQSRQLEMIELLLAHKADVNALNNEGQTPLGLLNAPEPRTSRQTMPAIRSIPTRAIRQQPGVGGAVQSSPPVEESDKIIQLLRQHGASENLHRLSFIRVSRSDPSFGDPAPKMWEFLKDKNSYNRCSLLELIATIYGGDLQRTFPFPDFEKLEINRIDPDTKQTQDLKVNLAASFSAGDCSKDMWLEWGDIIELPERDHMLNEQGKGLPGEVQKFLQKCLARTVEIIVKGQTNKFVLAPSFPPQGSGASFQERLKAVLEQNQSESTSALPYLRLSELVRNSGLLRSSSDLSRVKVKRADPVTKRTLDLMFNLDDPSQGVGVWLRDGDVIEIPEKSEVSQAEKPN